ncbi:MAG TPA: NAD(P)-dependent oxidoreductase, partial [Acidimicrobiia bacterium]|nr:NAD(P)-dependent oxidoreductase [Acidimicrobiia bacterium]
MGRVVVTRRLPEGGTEPLAAAGHDVVLNEDDIPFTKAQLCDATRDADALLCVLTDRIDDDVLDAGEDRLRIVATVAVGYDNIDVAAAASRGIAVCNTPGVLDETTADLAFLLILSAARLASDAERDLRTGRWPGWAITQYLGVDVHGAILGVVGFGRIGQAVARRAAGFGMEVLHHTRTPTGLPGYVADLDHLLAESDIVSLHVPLSEDTRHMIDR